jgi:hypothetical protein
MLLLHFILWGIEWDYLEIQTNMQWTEMVKEIFSQKAVDELPGPEHHYHDIPYVAFSRFRRNLLAIYARCERLALQLPLKPLFEPNLVLFALGVLM